MKYIICFYILSMATICHAQKSLKNEVALGYSYAYFYDSTGWKTNDFSNIRFPVLFLTRSFGKNVFANLSYGKYVFRYTKDKFSTDIFNYERNKLLTRVFTKVSLGTGYKISTKLITLKANLGLTYEFAGQSIIFRYAGKNQYFDEAIYDVYLYKYMGASAGLSISHPIFRSLFGELRGEYSKMFGGIDRRQMMLYYSIGYKF